MHRAIITTAAGLLLLWSVAAAPVPSADVESVSPVQNELNVAVSANIIVTFNANMNEATINASTFIVSGEFCGSHSGTISYENATRTATFDPDSDFSVGETVTAWLTAGIESSMGEPLVNGFGWTFTVVVESGASASDIDFSYPSGSLTHSVITADLDGDGHLDLATGNFGSDNVSVRLNNGDGTFGSEATYGAGDGVRLVCAGDFDGDSDLDLATANGGDSTVSILLNNGDSTFASKVVYQVGAWPHSVFVADFDGDGDQDLATANEGTGDVSVLLNNGDGTFASYTSYTVGDVPRSVFAADLDGDGDFDLTTANKNSDNASVLLNNGDGTFAGHTLYPVGDHPRGVCVADVDGDGNLDIITANEYTYNLSVLPGNGDGSFAEQLTYATGGNSYCVVAADLDADGMLDLAASNPTGTVSVLYNNGDGTFTDPILVHINGVPVSLCRGDLDSDGDVELITADFNGNTVSVLDDWTPTSTSYGLMFSSTAGLPCDSCAQDMVVQPVACQLQTPATGVTVSMAIPEGVEVCGVSFEGLLTESWNYKGAVIKQDSGFFTVYMANSTGDRIPSDVPITLFNVQFAAPSQCRQSYFIRWDTALSADPTRATKFSDTLFQTFVPAVDVDRDSTEVLGYTPGNVDSYSLIDIGDVTTLINHMFLFLEPLCQANVGDVNGDCAGPDIGDLTMLISHLFVDLDLELRCGCILGAAPPAAKMRPEIVISTTYDGGNTTITLTSPVDLRGLQLELRGPASSEPTLMLGNDLDLVYGQASETLRLGILDLDGAAMLAAGETMVVDLPGEFDLISAAVADSEYRSMTPSLAGNLELSSVPASFELSQNYPNPFNPVTEIGLALPCEADVTLVVYNVMGQKVTTLAEGRFEAGIHTLVWDATDYSSGVYLYRLEAGTFVETKKMVLLK